MAFSLGDLNWTTDPYSASYGESGQQDLMFGNTDTQLADSVDGYVSPYAREDSPGMFYGEPGENMNWSMDPNASKWIDDNGYTRQYSNVQGGGQAPSMNYSRLVDGSGNQVGQTYGYKVTPDDNFWKAVMLAAGSGAGAIGGSIASGMGAGPLGTGISTGASAGAAGGIGGSGGDLEAGVKGGLLGALGGTVAGLNPAQYTGISNPDFGRYFNKAVTAAGQSALNGGNVKDSVLGSVAGSGLSAGLQAGAGALNNMGQYDAMGDYFQNGGSDMSMGDLGSNPQATDLGSWMNQFSQSSRAPQESLVNPGTNVYSPAATSAQFDAFDPSGAANYSPVAPAAQQRPQPNPFTSIMKQALGFNNNGTPNVGRFDSMAGNLLDLWRNHQQRKEFQSQANDLRSLFTENSPYAQQLKQTLLRHDAASGRRSQVGPRSVELQARLAELNSRNAPQIAALTQAGNNNMNGMTNAGMRFGMGVLQNLGGVSGVTKSLSDLFGE